MNYWFNKKIMMASTLWMLNSLMTSVSLAQEPISQFPSKPITIVVNFPVGGGTDILARILGNYFTESFGQPAIVENRAGASGNVGAKHVADKPSDGYSLLMVNSSYAINPGVFASMPFDPKKDLTPIINVAFIPSVLVVPADSPYKNLAALITAAKPTKNEVSFGSCGNGTPQHLAGAILNINAKTNITHIPYGGCGPALRDVLGGQIPMAIITASSAAAQIKADINSACGTLTGVTVPLGFSSNASRSMASVSIDSDGTAVRPDGGVGGVTGGAGGVTDGGTDGAGGAGGWAGNSSPLAP
jgi:tripartite-type tricarboxylate transporter receptor subunit TctC